MPPKAGIPFAASLIVDDPVPATVQGPAVFVGERRSRTCDSDGGVGKLTVTFAFAMGIRQPFATTFHQNTDSFAPVRWTGVTDEARYCPGVSRGDHAWD